MGFWISPGKSASVHECFSSGRNTPYARTWLLDPSELSAMHKTDGLELRPRRATEGVLLSSESRLGMSAMLTVTTMRLESSGKMGVWG